MVKKGGLIDFSRENLCNLWLKRGIKMDIEKEYEGKTILVTGGAGCIGTNLCRKLAEL